MVNNWVLVSLYALKLEITSSHFTSPDKQLYWRSCCWGKSNVRPYHPLTAALAQPWAIEVYCMTKCLTLEPQLC